jgi:hypothetical protein
MLEKKPGNFRVDKLRAILVYEADFNQNKKNLGCAMMRNAELMKLPAPEQYGSWKKMSAIDQCLSKRLALDLFRQSCRPAAMTCSNDAKSCYDQIVHSIASLCMQQNGVPEAPVVCMFTTIQNLSHYIRTIFGDSRLNFGGDMWTVTVQGVGQGNGAGLQIWAIILTPVLNMMREEGVGAFFKASISGDELSFVGYAFVDDTDLCETAVTGHATVQR